MELPSGISPGDIEIPSEMGIPHSDGYWFTANELITLLDEVYTESQGWDRRAAIGRGLKFYYRKKRKDEIEQRIKQLKKELELL